MNTINTDPKGQYSILVNGLEMLSGDAASTGVIFGNLDGWNFKPRPGLEQTHAQWLAYAAAAFNVPLEIGAPFQLLNAEGGVVSERKIGDALAESLPAEQGSTLEAMTPR